MSEPFIGEVRAFSFPFAPRGWAFCNGQTMQIAQFQALFALLGTTYGGNGVQTFALPNLQGRVALHVGSANPQGQVQGVESVQLGIGQIPQHTHLVTAAANGSANATNVPGPAVILGSGSSSQTGTPAVNTYSNAAPSLPLAPLGASGGSQPHENRMPSSVLNYCIALQGIF